MKMSSRFRVRADESQYAFILLALFMEGKKEMKRE
jgi:hypothetical protein